MDDLLHERGIVASVLDLTGAGVFEVALASEAKATIPHLRPDAIITEMALPDATGVDLARWVRGYDVARERSTVVRPDASVGETLRARARGGLRGYSRSRRRPTTARGLAACCARRASPPGRLEL